jgi:hypothetical protein
MIHVCYHSKLYKTATHNVSLDCKLTWSKHIDEERFVCDITIEKTSPTGPSFITPGLLLIYIVKCHKDGHRQITVGAEQSSTVALKI